VLAESNLFLFNSNDELSLLLLDLNEDKGSSKILLLLLPLLTDDRSLIAPGVNSYF